MSINGKYCFPYPPYDIQNQLMDAIYEALDSRQVAIIESPTGTGKSLSIICSVIKWIKDFEENQLNCLTEELKNINKTIEELSAESQISCDWIQIQNQKSIICRKKDSILKQLKRFEYKKERNKSLIQRKNNSVIQQKFDSNVKNLTKKLKTDSNCDSSLDSSELDEDFLDYCSDEEVMDTKSRSEEDETFVRPKVYYCSRTHSQLSQFVNEIKKTCYSREERPLRTVMLGSRNNYCINESVLKLNNNNLINEKCIELQNSSKIKTKCQMFKQNLFNELKEEILSDVLDIEDINKLGKGIKACPYYSTRLAIPEAEIVIIPYNILLHSATRESFGICLKESVVIVDESHNLLETIHNIHSIELKGSHVIDALTQLNRYLSKYKTRLSAKNTMHIKQIIFILNQFLKHFKQSSQQKSGSNVVERVEFLISLKIENLNLYKILDYCQKSRIARKLFGFSQKSPETENNSESEDKSKGFEGKTGTTAFLAKMKGKSLEIQSIPSQTLTTEDDIKTLGSPLYVIQEFLKALINTETNAKIITNLEENSIRNSSIKYILLNPGTHFKDIISECRSVILCGGTMKPFDEYIDHLLTPLGVPSNRLKTFSCGHVIPDSNLLALCLGVGPNQIPLNYTFQNRNNCSMIEETGKTIGNLCSIIPGGIVCFFPSYDFEDNYHKIWLKSEVLKSIESKGKRVFREPKKASQVSSILCDYSRAISVGKGALLMCVVGGKMSEGINFSDDLGRAVIVVGLPYPNKNSVELKEKINYFNQLKPNSGNIFYENLCMKAVNQSIGRAIRHKNDFAVIILLDNRYTNRANIRESLPDWIKSRVKCFDKFGLAFSSVRQFFANK